MRPLRSFRARLVVTFVSLVALTAVVLGMGSYLLVAGSLRDRLVGEAVSQAEFNIAVLAARTLPASPTREDFERSALEEAFRLRGAEVHVSFASGDPYASRFAFRDAPRLVSPRLRELVGAGRLAYEWVRVEGDPYLVTAGRLPGGEAEFYFFSPATEVEAALLRLREVLMTGGALLVAAAAVSGGLLARRVLGPVRAGSEAARRAADGDLSVRLPVRSEDELGAWAEAFNRMAAALEEKLAELEAAYAAQRRFVADVSHELRTPLTALANEATLLEPHLAGLGEDRRRLAELLVRDVRRLRGLVEDLMEISRFDAASEEASPAPFELGPFLEAVVRARLPEASLHLAPGPGEVETDRRRLERIVANLLDNARRHAEAAGVEVSAEVGDGELVVEVADRGPGVPPDQLPRLFERFHKADPSRPGEGSGLGLAIAREHARLLGGELTARLRPGGGRVFELRLPVTGSLPRRDPTVTEGGEAEEEPTATPGTPRGSQGRTP